MSSLPFEGLLHNLGLFDLRWEDVPLYFRGSGAVADVLFGSPRRREAVQVLSQYGYWRVSGGKGSHEKWRGPGNREFTLPNRDPLSVGVFHELLHEFRWTKQQYLREIRPALH